ncbi:hypothetical protein ScPMuIL_016207 [Solemya velum]
MSGNRATLDLSGENIDDLTEYFDTIDSDGSGFIQLSELQQALKICGFDLPGYEVRNMIMEYDRGGAQGDGKLDFQEFQGLYAKLKQEKDFGHRYKKVVQTRTDLQTHAGTTEASVEGTTHTVRKAETEAFAEWINRNLASDVDCKNYLPLRPETSDLYTSCKDGILLCKMVNRSVPDTIDERVINKANLNIYRRSENHSLVLNSASSIGCNIVNIGPDDLDTGKPHLVLGLLWQIIRIGLLSEINLTHHPGLVHLLEEGETIEDLMKLTPEQILIRWVNYQLENSGANRRINNFGDDIKDSEAYTYLLHRIAPAENNVTLQPLGESDMLNRAESMLREADKIGCRSFVSAKDVVAGNPKLNLAFVANLFNSYPALENVVDKEFEIVEETREEKTYRNWMNSLGVNPFISYLYNDLNSGVVIFQLYDFIRPGVVDWNRVTQKFTKMRKVFEKIENCNYAVSLGKDDLKFSLVGVGGQDISEGNQTLTLALVWQLMRAYTLTMLTSLSGTGHPVVEKEIIEWAKQKLASGKKTSKFTNFQDSSLADGKVIIDLIDCLKRNTVDYKLVRDEVTAEARLSNAKYAISLARKIGAKVYALPEDICEVKPKMIMTIFACLMTRDYSNPQVVTDGDKNI